MTPYTILRSERKTLSITVDRQAQVQVRAPRHMPEADIKRFVESRAAWIQKAVASTQTSQQKNPPITGLPGSMLPYCGIPVKIESCAGKAITLQNGKMLLGEDCPEGALRAWLKAQALAALTARAQYRAQSMGLAYTGLRLSDAKTRWGCCTAKNILLFNWRLILCPPEVLDYIVVHELCHIRHKDHSAPYWASVCAVLPDYKVREAWLKGNRCIIDAI